MSSQAHTAARLLAGLAHPDFALIRREWQGATKRLATEISVDAVRHGLQVFQLSAAFGGWRIAIVDSAEDLNRNSANALLKMVEEPPQRSLILIVSHRPGQVLPTIRSRCRRLRLDPLNEDEIIKAVIGLGPPWSEAGGEAVAAAAKRADGSVREALIRLAPESEGVERADRLDRRRSAAPRSPGGRQARRRSRRARGRRGLRAFHRELYDWLATYARDVEPGSLRVEEIGGLWDRIRDAQRETEELNLDRKLHILALFAEIAATAPGGEGSLGVRSGGRRPSPPFVIPAKRAAFEPLRKKLDARFRGHDRRLRATLKFRFSSPLKNFCFRTALMSRFYITTAIPYANGAPHIGHAYERIATDAIQRFMRLDGRETLFVTGMDEHGLKVQQAAAREGISPQQFVDRVAAEFEAMGEMLNARADDIVRTTSRATTAPRRRSGSGWPPTATSICRNIPAGIRCATRPISTRAN